MKEEKMIQEDKKMSYTGIFDICGFLNITTRTWRNYRERSTHFPVIKRAEEKIYANWAQNLFFPGRNTTGAIFYLKNFAGMADKQEVQHNVSGQIEHTKKLQKLPDGQLQQLNQLADAIDVTPEKEEAQNDSD
jgi:hypothetical protein